MRAQTGPKETTRKQSLEVGFAQISTRHQHRGELGCGFRISSEARYCQKSEKRQGNSGNPRKLHFEFLEFRTKIFKFVALRQNHDDVYMDDNAATVPRDANAVMADAAAEPAVVKPGDGWVHVKKGLNEQQRECWTCNYCGKETLGRNATRVSAFCGCAYC